MTMKGIQIPCKCRLNHLIKLLDFSSLTSKWDNNMSITSNEKIQFSETHNPFSLFLYFGLYHLRFRKLRFNMLLTSRNQNFLFYYLKIQYSLSLKINQSFQYQTIYLHNLNIFYAWTRRESWADFMSKGSLLFIWKKGIKKIAPFAKEN